MPIFTNNAAAYDSFKEAAVSNILFRTRSWIRKFGFNPEVGFRGTGTSTVDVNYDILMVKNNT